MSFIHKQTKILFSCKSLYLSASNCKGKKLVLINSKPFVYSSFSSVSYHPYSTLQVKKSSKTCFLINASLSNPVLSTYCHLSTDGNRKSQDVVQFVNESVLSGAPFAGESSKAAAANLEASFPAENISQQTEFFNESTAALSSIDLSSVTENIEVPLSSLGLAGWSPVGMVQQGIELLHLGCDLPWWGAICVATIIARIITFPILVIAQRNTAKMSTYMPELQYLQAKFAECRRSGNKAETARYAYEIMEYMKKHDVKPLKTALIPLCQAPVFLSFFWALRGMANLPVESLKTGGIGWITDLTVADPYFITPLITCSTLFIILKTGAESGVHVDSMKLARYFVYAIPVVLVPCTMYFPAAVLCYWCTTNIVTLGTVNLLKVPRVREFLKIPKFIRRDAKSVTKKKGFIASVKEAYEDQKALASVGDRTRMDQVRFTKSGLGPVPRTYAYDPTKPRPASAASTRKEGIKGFKT